jgi:predicted protein tyrosine phosphatase
MIREVDFMSQARAEYFKPMKREAIISITGSGHPRANLRKGWSRVLRLVFDDVERPGFGAIPFDTDHAEMILHWLDEVERQVDKVFVHCHAGRSRSAAVTKFIAEKYDLSGGIRVYEEHNCRVYRILTRRCRFT